MKVTRSLTVAAAPQAVHDYLADFAHAVHWDPGTVSCERIDIGPVRVGSTWHNVSRFVGRTVELDYTLVRLDPDRLVFEGVNDASMSRDDLRFTPRGDGTLIEYRATIVLTGWLGAIVGPLLTLPIRRVADKTVRQMAGVLGTLD